MGFSWRMSSALCAIALACTACSAAGASGAATAPATIAPAPTHSAEMSGLAEPGSLVVLGDDGGNGASLWRLDAGGEWTSPAFGGDASALSVGVDGILVTNGRTIATRRSSDLSTPGSSIELKWPAGPIRSVVALDQSPSGEYAIVTQEGTKSQYYTASRDGKVNSLVPAPAESFTPMASWLDDTRLMVLSTGSDQVSRLAVVDMAAKTLSPIKTIGGLTSFALSADRETLAVASGSEILAEPVISWTGGLQPQRVAAVEAGKVVWGLALDRSGNRLAVLSGVVSADGRVSGTRDTCYSRRGDAWLKSCDVETKMLAPKSQIWVP